MISQFFLDAHQTTFQQTNYTFQVPIFRNAKHVYDNLPLIKFETVDGAARKFSIDKSVDFLHIDESTGELWLKEKNFYGKNVASVQNLKIISKTSNDDDENEEDTMETTANINFIPYYYVRDFCEASMCFYDSIEFHAVEDFNENFKMREIGEIVPRFYRRICRKYHVEYQLLNGKICSH